MKAAVFHGLGKPLAIETVPDPACGPGDVLMRINYCGICGSDLHATQEGVYVVPGGTILGHEVAAEVVEVGKDAKGLFKVGERVTTIPINACASCSRTCRLGLGIHCPNNIITGFGIPGAYAEYLRADAGHVLRLPPGVSDQKAAMIEPLAVGFHAVERAQMKPGANVLVLGAGPIGLSTALFAHFAGARRVVVSEFAANRRERALRFGATHAIDPKAAPALDQFKEIAGGAPDLIFECVGVKGLIQECIDMLPPFGKLMVVGVCMQPDTIVPISGILKEATLQFVIGYVKRDFEVIIDLLEAGRVDPMPMLTDMVEFDQLPAAFEALRKPTTQCKVMLKPH
jgi:(R,R)-butanediol dehydrogenase/meso-butanediol dehydrogenase/diacetyl reductase